VDIELVAASDGAELFHLYGEDSESRGLTKVPTGISDVVLEPIRGLNADIISNLSRRIVKKVIKPLLLESRLEFLTSSPPSVYASSHDSTAPFLDPKDGLVIVMFGTPNTEASFSLGRKVRRVPMIERSPGHYFGQYHPVEGISFGPQQVYVELKDSVGRITRQAVERPKVAVH